jgi:hypothetical protein
MPNTANEMRITCKKKRKASRYQITHLIFRLNGMQRFVSGAIAVWKRACMTFMCQTRKKESLRWYSILTIAGIVDVASWNAPSKRKAP